jgi:hypothetical protein
MALTLPKSFFHSFVRQRSHGKPGMRYAKSALLFSKHLGSCVNSLTLRFALRHGSGGIDPMLQNQVMNFSHAFHCLQFLS